VKEDERQQAVVSKGMEGAGGSAYDMCSCLGIGAVSGFAVQSQAARKRESGDKWTRHLGTAALRLNPHVAMQLALKCNITSLSN